jgi:hypothetical protein
MPAGGAGAPDGHGGTGCRTSARYLRSWQREPYFWDATAKSSAYFRYLFVRKQLVGGDALTVKSPTNPERGEFAEVLSGSLARSSKGAPTVNGQPWASRAVGAPSGKRPARQCVGELPRGIGWQHAALLTQYLAITRREPLMRVPACEVVPEFSGPWQELSAAAARHQCRVTEDACRGRCCVYGRLEPYAQRLQGTPRAGLALRSRISGCEEVTRMQPAQAQAPRLTASLRSGSPTWPAAEHYGSNPLFMGAASSAASRLSVRCSASASSYGAGWIDGHRGHRGLG